MDNTKVNEFQEKILQAMQIVSAKTLESVSYDTTIVATISDNTDKENGKYILTDGNKTFTAYSTVTTYSNNTSVFVTIPNGNWENQKIIIGKKTSDIDSPFVFTNPFDNFFALTQNLAGSISNKEGRLLANDIDDACKGKEEEDKKPWAMGDCLSQNVLLDADVRIKGETDDNNDKTVIYVDEPVVDCSCLGVRAEFQSWIKKAVRGTYGLEIILTGRKPVTVQELEENAENKYQENIFPFLFSNEDMFGSVYNFESYYQQEIVAKLEEADIGELRHIKIAFVQNADFYDINDELLPMTQDGWAKHSNSDIYKRYGDTANGNDIIAGNGYYIGEGEELEPNLFVKNIEVYLGEDLSTYSSDYIRIYTADTDSYKRSTSLGTDNSDYNMKNIKMHWVHIDENEDPIDMISNSSASDLDFKICWYQYEVGAAAADEYCGIYWKKISGMSEEEEKENEEKVQAAKLSISEAEALIMKNEEKIQELDDEISDNEELTEDDIKNYQEEIEKLEEENEMLKEKVQNCEQTLKECKILETSIAFSPNVNKQQEKIKAIAFLNGVAYRTNELIFTNDEIVPLDAESYHILNALSIEADDGSNGNYFIYGQNDEIKDTDESKKIRTLSAYFDANNDGIIDKENEKITSVEYFIDKNGNKISDDSCSLKWIFPIKNSMLKLINGTSSTEPPEEGKTIYNNIFKATTENNQPQYTIDGVYSPGYSNNTVTCEYVLNGVTYTSEKEFVFGPLGTMGYEETLFIKIAGDNHAVLLGGSIKDGNSSNVSFEVLLRDAQGKYQEIPDGSVEWSWKYCIDNNEKLKLTSEEIIDGETFSYDYKKGDSILNLPEKEFDINHLYILQASVGDLTTYFSVPIRTQNCNYIKGCTEVRYQTNGEPQYSKESYVVYDATGKEISDITWNIFYDKTFSDDNKKEEETRYIGTMYNYDKIYKLQPLSIYVEDALVYGVCAKKKDGSVIWSQPVLVIQNRWSSTTINRWDGKTLTVDEGTNSILAAAIAAGKKESDDNSFTGVMIGDWGARDLDTNEVISQNTGVYGFHHGRMSYAFKDDGTAFIGKSGVGRINFDGNKGIIESASYAAEDKKHGIQIDLKEPYLILSNSKEGTASASTTTYPFQVGSKFKIKWDGTIYATNGHFTGAITGSSIKSNSSIDGAVITGSQITGSKIYASSVYFGDGTYWTYKYLQQNPDGTYPDEKVEENWLEGVSISNPENSLLEGFQYKDVEEHNGKYNGIIGQWEGSDENTTTSVIGIKSSALSLALETPKNIRLGLSDTTTEKTEAVYIQAEKIEFIADAEQQFGIYARFAE